MSHTTLVSRIYEALKDNADHWMTANNIANTLGVEERRVSGAIAPIFRQPDTYPNVTRVPYKGRYRYNTPVVHAPTPEPVQPKLIEPRHTFTDLLKQLAAMNDAMTTNHAVADKLETAALALEDQARQLRHQAITLRGIR